MSIRLAHKKSLLNPSINAGQRCLKFAFMLFLMLAINLPASKGEERTKADKKPNVVLILADDLGIGDVSAYNPKGIIPTPNIDLLGKSGVRFTDAHVSAAVCMPSRAGLITGRQGTRHGSEFNAGPGLLQSEQNIAELLKSAGYRTGVVGKWHLGFNEGREPNSQGFDEFFGLHGGALQFIDPKSKDAINGYGVSGNVKAKAGEPQMFRNRTPVEETEYLTDALTREAIDFVERNQESPFFLYLAYNAPHSPHQTIQKYYDRFAHIQDHNSRVYAAMVSAVDDGVGQVVQSLKKLGLDQNTIVVFLSDNGGPDYFDGGPSNAPFSGWKRYHLEGGHRVPLFISWPSVIPGDRVDSRLISSLDLFPTFAALAGAEVSKTQKLDGVDLLPYLTEDVTKVAHKQLFWRAGANYAVRDGKWKLLVVNKTTQESFQELDRSSKLLRDGPYEGISPLGQQAFLYDLESDPTEKHNLIAEHPEIVEQLRASFQEWNQDNVPPNAKSSRGIPTVIDGTVVQLAF